MKARYIRPLKKRNPQYNELAARARAAEGKDYPIPQYVPAPAGTVIEHPDAWRLVANGDAEPACPACEQRVRQYFQKRGVDYDKGIAEAIKHRDRLDKGIHPKHFEAYEEGRMDGYDQKGRAMLNGQLVELEEDQPQDQFVIVLDSGQSQEQPAQAAKPAETL